MIYKNFVVSEIHPQQQNPNFGNRSKARNRTMEKLKGKSKLQSRCSVLTTTKREKRELKENIK